MVSLPVRAMSLRKKLFRSEELGAYSWRYNGRRG